MLIACSGRHQQNSLRLSPLHPRIVAWRAGQGIGLHSWTRRREKTYRATMMPDIEGVYTLGPEDAGVCPGTPSVRLHGACYIKIHYNHPEFNWLH